MLSGSAQTRSTPALATLGRRVDSCAASGAVASASTTKLPIASPQRFRNDIGLASLLSKRRRSGQRPDAVAVHRNLAQVATGGGTRRSPTRVLLLEREDRQHPTLGGELTRIAERAERAQTSGRILGTDTGGHADAGPATDARIHRNVLLLVRPRVAHRVADDARGGLELPEFLAGLGVNRLEPAFHRAVEDQAAGGRHCAAVSREVLLDLPFHGAGHGIPGDETATIAARAREHPHDGAHVGLACRILDLDALVVHADVVGRHVEQAGNRRIRRRLLILEADRRGADALGVLLRGGPVLGILLRYAGGDHTLDRGAGALAHGPVDRAVGIGDDHLAVGPVDGVTDAVTVEVGEQLLAAALEQHVLVHAVVVPLIVRCHLVGPDHLTGLGLAGEDGHGPLVVARTLIGVPGPRVANAVVEVVQLGVVGVPAPGGAAAALPLVALPGRDPEVLPLVGGVIGVGIALDPDFLVGAGAVHRPLVLPAVDVEGREAAADAEFTTRDAGDDQVLDHNRGDRNRGALLVANGLGAGVGVIRVLRLPELLTGLRVQRDQLTLQGVDEDLPARVIGGAAVHQVATRDWNRIRRLVGGVLPDLRRAGLRKIERVDDVGERRVHVHHVPNDQRIARVTAERPGREHPRS